MKRLFLVVAVLSLAACSNTAMVIQSPSSPVLITSLPTPPPSTASSVYCTHLKDLVNAMVDITSGDNEGAATEIEDANKSLKADADEFESAGDAATAGSIRALVGKVVPLIKALRLPPSELLTQLHQMSVAMTDINSYMDQGSLPSC